MNDRPSRSSSTGAVWLDQQRALVVTARDGHAIVARIDRDADLEPAFLLRIARATADCDRVIVMGSAAAKLAFEREYVALNHRPDRVVELPVEGADARKLVERLAALGAPYG